MKKILKSLVAIVAVSTAMTTISCGPEQIKPVQQTPKYNAVKLDTTSANVYVDFAAEIQGDVVVEIRPRVQGYVEKIAIEEGSNVKKGELLFKIDSRELEQTLNAAKANVDAVKAQMANAELEIEKLDPLVKKGIISEYELINAKTNFLAAKANLTSAKSQCNNAKINLSFASVKSPVDGVIGRIVVRVGTLVSPSTTEPLTTVSADENMAAYFSFDEKSIMDMTDEIESTMSLQEKFEKLPNASLILSNGELYPREGKLELASGLVDMTTGSVQVKANFANQNGRLRSGSSGVVRLNSPKTGIFLVPQKATYEMQDRKMIYVIGDSSKVVSKTIKVDGETKQFYVVSQGLNIGDVVLVDGIDYVRSGDTVEPIL